MRKKYTANTKKSLRENVQIILPLIFENFFLLREKVVNHPRLKSELHRMRIIGKPMRYLMEVVENSFIGEFKGCLGEMKKVIELMGEIHDCDVSVPVLLEHLKEVRCFNKSIYNRQEKFSTKGIRDLIKQLREKRNSMYAEFCKHIKRWEGENFREKLINSMQKRFEKIFITDGSPSSR